MSPTSREREYAKRRYEKWQQKQAVRYARRRRQRQILLAAGAALAVVAVIAVSVFYLTRGNGTDTAAADAAASTSPSASPAASSSPKASPSTSGSASNPCGKPPAKPAAPKSWPKPPAASLAQGKTWTWTLETSCGPVLISLDGAKAPQAVASTVFLSQQGFYTGVPCHRLTTQGIYVLQCGDPTGTGSSGPGYSYGPVENAPADNVYPAGTVAMARVGGQGSSMGSQFFLVYKDSTIPSDAAGGYTVMGKITGGLDTVEKVAAGGLGADQIAPARAVSIVSSTVAPS